MRSKGGSHNERKKSNFNLFTILFDMTNISKKADKAETRTEIILFSLLIFTLIFLKQICKAFIYFNNFLDTQIFNS